MTKAEKLELIEAFEKAYGTVDSMIAGLSRQDLAFVPPVKDAWSVNETLVHYLDADMSLWFRVRMSIAQPGFTVPVWDQEAWCAKLGYEGEDGLDFLAQTKVVRHKVGATLRRMADADWDGFWVRHPERGEVKLAKLLEIYRDHVAFHVPLIQRNLDALPGRRG